MRSDTSAEQLLLILGLFHLLVGCLQFYRKGRARASEPRDLLATSDPTFARAFVTLLMIALVYFCIELYNGVADRGGLACFFSSTVYAPSGPCYDPENQFYSGMFGLFDQQDDLLWLAAILMLINWTCFALFQESEINKIYARKRVEGMPIAWENQPTQVFGITTPEAEEEDEPPQRDPETPVTYEEVLAAIEAQLEAALLESERLKEELGETRLLVTNLEEQLSQKTEEIEHITASRTSFNEAMAPEEKASGKQLNLTDSVMVGDSVMGGVKIDSQINNDPAAIAQAVILAFKQGMDQRSADEED